MSQTVSQPVKLTRSELKRKDILEGARRAFKEFGVVDASMDKVAEMANVSKRTVYNHFESKEVLVSYIIRDIWSKTMVDYDFKYNPNSDLKSQLMELVLNEVQLSQKEEFFELVRIAINYGLFSQDSFRTEMSQFFEQDTALIRWLKAACNDGRFDNMEPLKANKQIKALLKGQSFWPQILRFEAPLNEAESHQLAEETVDLILARYKKAE